MKIPVLKEYNRRVRDIFPRDGNLCCARGTALDRRPAPLAARAMVFGAGYSHFLAVECWLKQEHNLSAAGLRFYKLIIGQIQNIS